VLTARDPRGRLDGEGGLFSKVCIVRAVWGGPMGDVRGQVILMMARCGHVSCGWRSIAAMGDGEVRRELLSSN
jgi:hypothetical protein